MTTRPGRDRPRPIATCLGSGGAFGVAFNCGVTDALIDYGLPVAGGPMIGSSAGAWTAAALATGANFDDVMGAWERHLSDRPARVIEISRELFGDRKDHRVTGVAIQLPLMRRTALRGSRYPLADIVAASSSPLRLARPHRIGLSYYIDNVTRFSSADLSPAARLQLVITPLGGRVLGRLGWVAERSTRYEMRRWKERHHGILLFVRPNRAIAELCEDTNSLFSLDVARATYPLAYQLGLSSLDRFKANHPDVAAQWHHQPEPRTHGQRRCKKT